MVKRLALAMVASFGLTHAAFAVDRYVWDDQGLQKAPACRTTSQPKLPYAASLNGGGQWELVSSSVSGARDLRGFVLQVKGATSLTIGDRPLQGTYLEPAFDGNDYLIYLCPRGVDKKAYIAFNVFAAGREGAVAQVGVAKAGFDFLKSATLQTADEATKKLIATATPTATSAVKSASPMGKMTERDLGAAKLLGALSPANRAKITFYDPDQNSALEGGPKNRFTESINSVEDSIKNGRPVTVAADMYGDFGRLCNQREKRCLVLIALSGFDALYPAYRKKFSQLPKDHFLGIVEDTGGAFYGSGGKHFDVAVRSRKLARAVPSFVGRTGVWARMAGPCGTGSSSRRCDLTNTQTASLR